MATLTTIDASLLAGWLEPTDIHHESATDALDVAAAEGEILIPAVAYGESLGRPYRIGEDLGNQIASRIEAIGSVVPVTEGIGRKAARLRASQVGLKMPDALIIATALERRTRLLTLDLAMRNIWQRVSSGHPSAV